MLNDLVAGAVLSFEVVVTEEAEGAEGVVVGAEGSERSAKATQVISVAKAVGKAPPLATLIAESTPQGMPRFPSPRSPNDVQFVNMDETLLLKGSAQTSTGSFVDDLQWSVTSGDGAPQRVQPLSKSTAGSTGFFTVVSPTASESTMQVYYIALHYVP